MVGQLWNLFLQIGLVFLIFIVCYAFFLFIVNILTGNKKSEEQLNKEKIENLIMNAVIQTIQEELKEEIKKVEVETKEKENE